MDFFRTEEEYKNQTLKTTDFIFADEDTENEENQKKLISKINRK